MCVSERSGGGRYDISIGQVDEFSYFTGTSSQRRYTLEFAPIPALPNADKGLGCYCMWYKSFRDGILIVMEINFTNSSILKTTFVPFLIPFWIRTST